MELFQPLPIPVAVWEDLHMEFMTGLPPVKGKSVIVVVVDQLTKYCHFGSLLASYSASSVVEHFIKQIIRFITWHPQNKRIGPGLSVPQQILEGDICEEQNDSEDVHGLPP